MLTNSHCLLFMRMQFLRRFPPQKLINATLEIIITTITAASADVFFLFSPTTHYKGVNDQVVSLAGSQAVEPPPPLSQLDKCRADVETNATTPRDHGPRCPRLYNRVRGFLDPTPRFGAMRQKRPYTTFNSILFFEEESTSVFRNCHRRWALDYSTYIAVIIYHELRLTAGVRGSPLSTGPRIGARRFHRACLKPCNRFAVLITARVYTFHSLSHTRETARAYKHDDYYTHALPCAKG